MRAEERLERGGPSTRTRSIRTGIALLLTLLMIATMSPAGSSAYVQHEKIVINGNEDFTAANGVVDGIGKSYDPFIIENLSINTTESVDGINIRNTDAYFILRHIQVNSSNSGIYLRNVMHARIENCTLTNCSFGIYLRDSTECEMLYNNLSYNYFGIFPWNCTDLDLMGNSYYENNEDYFVPQADEPVYDPPPWGTAVAAVTLIIVGIMISILIWYRRKYSSGFK